MPHLDLSIPGSSYGLERFQEKWTRFSVRKRDQIRERFQEKWTWFSVRKRDQNRNLEHCHESINLGKALGRFGHERDRKKTTVMNIGEAAQLSNLPVKTIRYYEDIGLVKAKRRDNGYRDYDENHVHKLKFIQRARGLGFSIVECRNLISLYEDKKARKCGC